MFLLDLNMIFGAKFKSGANVTFIIESSARDGIERWNYLGQVGVELRRPWITHSK